MDDAHSIFMQRFPLLALEMFQVIEGKIEAEKIEPMDLNNVELLYFYGLSDGAIFDVCKTWLDSSKLKKLVILEDDLGVIAAFLKMEKASQLLSHSQVFLERFSKDCIPDLCKKYPEIKLEFKGLKSKNKTEELRLEFLKKTSLTASFRIDRLHGYQPFANFLLNAKRVHQSFYANHLKKKFQNIPAIVCGAGPSLQKTIETLKKMENKALIIAGGSAIAALSSQGILPHFGVAIDPNLEEYRRFRNSFAFEMPLIYSTRVHPDIFRTCNGPFGYLSAGIGGMPEFWLDEELGIQDLEFGKNLSDETASVTGIALAFAQEMGCNPILINGVDMAYSDNRRYASGVVDEDIQDFAKLDSEKSAPDRIVMTKNQKNQPCVSAIRWLMESKSLGELIKKYPEITFINTTEKGLGIENTPFIPIDKATKNFKEFPLREKVDQIIEESKIPENAEKIIQDRLEELRVSLNQLIDHLSILSGEKKGSAALAEIEMKEEIAYLFLFYDIHEIFEKDEEYWKNFLNLARKYHYTLESCFEEFSR